MSHTIKTLTDCAAEAEFQLLCAKENMNWLLALARAIQLAHTHGQTEVAAGLTSLAGYLSDTNFGHTSTAIREFAELSSSPSTSQNVDLSSHDAQDAVDVRAAQ
ncbi:hypothetical protein [Pseudomonas capsici]|uniref:hypothetical protein n=1 Tax=Pseudomonas capsici TaxID=2810614 RepID=UPI0021F159C6|nr:hypothetical protein [Pseudomonas capsici]MCV4285899.1 hypothetical protein [Pseudomonas capsici]